MASVDHFPIRQCHGFAVVSIEIGAFEPFDHRVHLFLVRWFRAPAARRVPVERLEILHARRGIPLAAGPLVPVARAACRSGCSIDLAKRSPSVFIAWTCPASAARSYQLTRLVRDRAGPAARSYRFPMANMAAAVAAPRRRASHQSLVALRDPVAPIKCPCRIPRLCIALTCAGVGSAASTSAALP